MWKPECPEYVLLIGSDMKVARLGPPMSLAMAYSRRNDVVDAGGWDEPRKDMEPIWFPIRRMHYMQVVLAASDDYKGD